MHNAEKYVCLRRWSSEGFRRGLQAAETHLALRARVSKHLEWGSGLLIAKLDIVKTYDTRKRGMPEDMQPMHWRLHRGRLLRLRTSDNLIDCSATATRGLPQGAPESSPIYIAVMEDIVDAVGGGGSPYGSGRTSNSPNQHGPHARLCTSTPSPCCLG